MGMIRMPVMPVALFFHADARAPHFVGDILQLGQPILDAQHGLLIVDVNAWRIRELREDRGVHVDKSHFRVFGEDVPAAGFAPLAHAPRCLVIGADVVSAPSDLQRFGFP